VSRSRHGSTIGDFVFDIRYSPLTDEHDNVLGVIGVATDITDHRRAEASIRESEERYRELFENANDIIYTHDLQGNFTSLNRSGERITGYSREEAALMNVADVIAPEYLNLAREMIAHKASEQSLDRLRDRHHFQAGTTRSSRSQHATDL
jgi:PAS domain S-box-containing protein